MGPALSPAPRRDAASLEASVRAAATASAAADAVQGLWGPRGGGPTCLPAVGSGDAKP